MFVQVIQGKVADAEGLKRQFDKWEEELRPQATGFLGSTGGITADGNAIMLARFESQEAAAANSDSDLQSQWWAETEKMFDGEVTFHDCNEVDEWQGGGSNNAGFVQVIQGRADRDKMRELDREMEESQQDRRSDVIGGYTAWHGDGGFTTVVYFTNEEEARKGEASMEDDDTAQQMMSLMQDVVFYDLKEPILR